MKKQIILIFSVLLILAAFVAVLTRTLYVRGFIPKEPDAGFSESDSPDEDEGTDSENSNEEKTEE